MSIISLTIPLFVVIGLIIAGDATFYLTMAMNQSLYIKCITKIVPAILLLVQTYIIAKESQKPPNLQSNLRIPYLLNDNTREIYHHNERGFHPYLQLLLWIYSLCLFGDFFITLSDYQKKFWAFGVGVIIFVGCYFLIGFSRLFMPYNARKILFNKRYTVTNFCYKIILPICLYSALAIIFLGHFTQVLTEKESIALISNPLVKEYPIALLIGIWIYSGFMGWAGILTLIYLLLTKPKYRISAALSAAGTFLMIISDIILAENLLHLQLTYLNNVVLITYWLGLTLLSWSVIQNWNYDYQMIT